MAKYGRGDAGILDNSVAMNKRRHPAQINGIGANPVVTQNQAGIGRIVRNGIEDLARRSRARIDPADAGIDNFNRRSDIVGGVHDVFYRAIGARQALLENKSQLDFDARLDKAREGDVAVIGKQHVIE